MRTQKSIQIENIVSKYKTQANQSKSSIEVHEDLKKMRECDISFDTDFEVIEFEKQLLIHFYILAAKGNANAYVVKLLEKYEEYYQSGILSIDEESFLVDNFELLASYLLDNINGWAECAVPLDMPSEWNELIPYILMKTDNSKIFIPRTETGQELVGFKNCSILVGEGYEYAFLRTFSSGLSVEKYSGETEFYKKSTWWTDLDKNSVDILIADLSDSFYAFDKKTADFLDASYELVTEGGEILICFSRQTIISKITKKFRSLLTAKHELAEAIELPNNKVLLHIIKASQKSFVMVNATSVTKEKGWGNSYKSLDIDRFVSMVKHADQPEFDKDPICRRFDYSQLRFEVFIPSFYLNFIGGVKLSSLTEICTNVVNTDYCESNEKVITVNNLSHVYSQGEIAVDLLKTIDMSRYRSYKRVEGFCVIMAISQNSVAIGYNLSNEQVLVPWNLLVLKTNSVDETRYIAACLVSKDIVKQICSLVAYKAGEKRIMCENWSDFVCLPHLTPDEQKEYILNASHQDWLEQEKQTNSSFVRFKQAIRLRKHALSQNISSFDSLFRTLKACYEENGGKIKKLDAISPISDFTVEDAFNLLGEKLTVILDRVDHIAEDQDWGACESIEPQSFIEDYEHQHAPTNFKFKNLWEDFNPNRFEKDYIDEETGKLLFHKGETHNAAWFPKAALTQVFENIIANAQSHGFADPNRNDYCIYFSWMTDGLNILIKVANNGTPIPNDMNTEEILQYGYSSVLNKDGHGGIGGGQIAEIMQKYGGNASVISSPEGKQTVTYILTMPLASLY